MSDVGETIYMPLAMQKINETAPGISLRSVSLPPNQLHEAMDEGAVDLAAGYFPDIKTQRFLYRRIGRHSHACIIRAGHPLQAARLSLEQFTSMQHVAVEAPGRRHEVFDEFLASKRIHRSIALRTPHFMSLPMIIAQTDMIATVPQALADFFADTGRIRQIGLPFVPPTFQANMYWNRSAHLDPANVWLRQTLFSAFQVVKSRAYDRNGVPAG